MRAKLATTGKPWKQSWLPLAKHENKVGYHWQNMKAKLVATGRNESKVGYHWQNMKAKLTAIGITWKQSWLPLAKHESKVGCHWQNMKAKLAAINKTWNKVGLRDSNFDFLMRMCRWNFEIVPWKKILKHWKSIPKTILVAVSIGFQNRMKQGCILSQKQTTGICVNSNNQNVKPKFTTIGKMWNQSWLPLAKCENKVDYHWQNVKTKLTTNGKVWKLTTIGKVWKQSWLPLAKCENKVDYHWQNVNTWIILVTFNENPVQISQDELRAL